MGIFTDKIALNDRGEEKRIDIPDSLGKTNQVAVSRVTCEGEAFLRNIPVDDNKGCTTNFPFYP